MCRQYPKLSATLLSAIDELEARIARLPRRNDWDLRCGSEEEGPRSHDGGPVETAVEIDSLMHGPAVYAHFDGGKNLFHGWADA